MFHCLYTFFPLTFESYENVVSSCNFQVFTCIPCIFVTEVALCSIGFIIDLIYIPCNIYKCIQFNNSNKIHNDDNSSTSNASSTSSTSNASSTSSSSNSSTSSSSNSSTSSTSSTSNKNIIS